MGRMNKKDLLLPMGMGVIQSIKGLSSTKRQRKGKFSCCFFLGQDAHPPLLLDIRASGSWAFTLRDLHECPPGSQPFGLRLNDPARFPVLQLADSIPWDVSASIIA